MRSHTAYLELDQRHLLHPLHHPSGYDAHLIFTRGQGIRLQAADGRTYIDGLSGLWNVLVGHGVRDLATAAQEQMEELAFCSNYIGSTSPPAIELAHRLAGMAYPKLNQTYFSSGGGESNDTAFKTARYYWKRMGKPGKFKVISRSYAYHGVTMAAMSATGIPAYWPMFEPRVPGFIHIPAPFEYRFAGDTQQGETLGQAAARALEQAIQQEGPETVAAFIAEPVQGAGGVIVPPEDYFPRVRQICDDYQVLLIADEVITGFGRTGKWFGLQHWGIEPDIMSFAKGITSGYLPLGGIQVSDAIGKAIDSAPPDQRWMHAFTYSGHPTCCAVALKNLALIESAGLVENAAARGHQLQIGLSALADDFAIIGNVRGLGLMWAIEFVSDRQSKEPARIGEKIRRLCQDLGLFTRISGSDSLILAPPLITTATEIDEMLAILHDALNQTAGAA